MPPLPGGDRGPQGLSGVLHDTGRRRNERAHADRKALGTATRCHGALCVGPSPRLRRLPRRYALRAAGHGGGGRSARHALCPGRRRARRRDAGREQSVLRFRPQSLHRLLAVRTRLRRDPEHARAHDGRSRLRFADCREPGRAVPDIRMRLLRRVRRGLPDGGPLREVAGRGRAARPHRDDHLRLLRRGLLAECRGQG